MPNDPKLSDGGAWRGSCDGGAQKEATDVGQSHERTGRVQARIAATVTRGAVRCSAWLGALLLGAVSMFVASGLIFLFCCLLGYCDALGEQWGRALLGN